MLDRHGMDPRGAYAERFWLPVVGPSSLWLLRRLVEGLEEMPEGFVADVADTARALGIGGPESRHAPLARSLQRCERFGLVRLETGRGAPDTVAVRRRLGPVPQHRLGRLPASLQFEHRRWEATCPVAADYLGRARAAAADLALLGEGRAGVERRLLRLGTHPAIAHAAAEWACDRWGDDPGPPPGAGSGDRLFPPPQPGGVASSRTTCARIDPSTAVTHPLDRANRHMPSKRSSQSGRTPPAAAD